MEFGTKIFFTPSCPISSRSGKNNAGKKFFSFLYFFANFFWNFFSGVEYELNSGLKFFSPFLGLSHPVLLGNNAGKGFF